MINPEGGPSPKIKEGAGDNSKEVYEKNPKFEAARQELLNESIGAFIDRVKSADSLEDAISLAPGTSPDVGMRSFFYTEDQLARAKKEAAEVAEKAKATWTPVVEKIRESSNNEDAREHIGHFESTFEPNFWVVAGRAVKNEKESKIDEMLYDVEDENNGQDG